MLAAIVEQVQQAQAGGTMTPWHWWAIGFGGQVCSLALLRAVLTARSTNAASCGRVLVAESRRRLLTLAYSLYRWDRCSSPPTSAGRRSTPQPVADPQGCRAQAALPKTFD